MVDWLNGARGIGPENDGRDVEVLVTEELNRPGKLVRGFDGVFRIVFPDNEMSKELTSVRYWRFT